MYLLGVDLEPLTLKSWQDEREMVGQKKLKL
jgi:hypothetical protein